jgi:hypothetical protein
LGRALAVCSVDAEGLDLTALRGLVFFGIGFPPLTRLVFYEVRQKLTDLATQVNNFCKYLRKLL